MDTDATKVRRLRLHDWITSQSVDIPPSWDISYSKIMNFILAAGLQNVLCDLLTLHFHMIGSVATANGVVRYIEMSVCMPDNSVIHSTIYEIAQNT